MKEKHILARVDELRQMSFNGHDVSVGSKPWIATRTIEIIDACLRTNVRPTTREAKEEPIERIPAPYLVAARGCLEFLANLNGHMARKEVLSERRNINVDIGQNELQAWLREQYGSLSDEDRRLLRSLPEVASVIDVEAEA